MASANWNESLEIVVPWSAALLFGPTALWVTVLGMISSLAGRRPQPPSTLLRRKRARNFALDAVRAV